MDKEVVYIYNGILLNHQKRILTIYINVDGISIILSKISQSEKEKYHMISLIYGIFKSKQTKKKHK